ncbi:Predicted DNA-binding protein, contains XRE-type HTH domain [Methylobacterium sp. 174MFSha1.1]|uniref:helix-turn-helix domain-containing protein n=1 Tax=Methylobacterium sp. 174MFSha1.1 TaxID=1502749 RepID=UPI0008F2AB8A|nr:helix-turn-helix transcriptional regulator [Methylobacterium sp. 174MFSha1.1]SFU49290.1 Predicted DNA-binding protein, contains XRE-type HTH domain [Methylobacterium sp. 174MFSha1.1]
MTTESGDIHRSGNNIFADLDFPDPETHLLKARIVAELYRLFTQRGITQTKAGEVMGISQPEVSRLFKGRFREYSVERLMSFLTAFDQDVEIIVRPHSKAGEAGTITFTPATA